MSRPAIHLHFRTFPEDHLWVGECLELDVCTSADTQLKASEGIAEATELYLRTIAEEGQLERILAERGIPIIKYLCVIGGTVSRIFAQS